MELEKSLWTSNQIQLLKQYTPNPTNLSNSDQFFAHININKISTQIIKKIRNALGIFLNKIDEI